MNTIFDKQIHRNDFRLRLLVTDGCNKNCNNCLNDFQSRPSKPRFLDPIIAKDVIESYCRFMGSNSQVEISGGEPGIYPHLREVIIYAKECNSFVKVNTNGTALNQRIEEFVDCWHVGVTKPEPKLIKDIVRLNGQVQFVVTRDTLRFTRSIVDFYGRHNIPIKLFVDFFSHGKEKKEIEEEITNIINIYSDFYIKTRYTGTQENRGMLCNECKRKCITLKALWVFVDGKTSPCPQGVVVPQSFHNRIIKAAFMGHHHD